MDFFMFLICFALITGFVAFMISWDTHVFMNKRENVPYDWCTFKTFAKEFDKYKNHPNLEIGYFCNDTSIFVKDKYYEPIVYYMQVS